MVCLLCQTGGAQLSRADGDTSVGACRVCGTYAFDRDFSDLVRHARANRDPVVLSALARLSDLVRANEAPLVLRRSMVTMFVDPQRVPRGAPPPRPRRAGPRDVAADIARRRRVRPRRH